MERLGPIDPLTWIAVFGCAAGIDVLSVWFTTSANRGEALKAAVVSAGLLVLSSITLYTFVENPLNLIPEIAGAALGTYISVKRDHRRQTLHGEGKTDQGESRQGPPRGEGERIAATSRQRL